MKKPKLTVARRVAGAVVAACSLTLLWVVSSGLFFNAKNTEK